jgi:hypothetical protein
MGVSDTARMGKPIESYFFGDNINPGATEMFSIPLLCGLIYLCEKELPLEFCLHFTLTVLCVLLRRLFA